ncbi:MAG TPA: hydrolase [Humidesulfovibrio sp.]|uniref:hydrolase n=1 Tax=Humidesulfovibrio sp. TaxID=2910988 RepID=UPI002B8C6444|nr:hydrolase [Humidesulfovibrio sp.]HWR02609.1 hydrolase [Humidesulfovibrio sp.]
MPHANRPALLLATDIFGHSPEAQALAHEFGPAVRIVSPYAGERPRFGSEMEAYAAFSARTSIEKYAEELAAQLRARPFDLALGFSVGASALWLCLAEASLAYSLPRRAILYYGSRIRQYSRLKPACSTRLVFAEREAAFDPSELAARLRAQGNDASVIPGSAHGFMNPLSPGYDARLAGREIAAIKALLS